MNGRLISWLAAVAAAVVVVALAVGSADEPAPGGAVEARVPFRQVLEDLVGPVRLRWPDLSGDVTIRPGAPGVLEVSATKTGYGPDRAAARAQAESLPLSVAEDGSDIILDTRSDGWLPWRRRTPGRVSFQLVAPESSSLAVERGQGSLAATGLHGGVAVRGTELGVRLSNVRGGVAVDAERGRITVDGGEGAVRLATAGGSVSAIHLAGPRADVRASEGATVAESRIDGPLEVIAGPEGAVLRRVRAETAEVASAGAVELSDASAAGELSIRAESGVVVERSGAYPLTVRSAAGWVELTEVQGDLRVTTQGSPVHLVRVSPDSLEVATGGGEVVFSGSLPAAGTVSIDAGRGDISMSIAKEAALDLDAETRGGRVVVDSRLLPDYGGGEVVRARIGGGGPVVRLRSTGGSIRLIVR